MRGIAILALVTALAIPAAAHKKPPKIIPALKNGRIIGVHCAERQKLIVGVHLCQEMIDRLRTELGSQRWTIENCPDVMNSDGGVAPECLPKHAADIMLEVYRDWEAYDADSDSEPVGAVLSSINPQFPLTVLDKPYCLSTNAFASSFFGVGSTGSAAACVVDKVARFIWQHDGDEVKVCAETLWQWWLAATDHGKHGATEPVNSEYKKFQKSCRKDGFPAPQ